jgi:hypothetical protein
VTTGADRWSGDALHALPVGTVVAYGRGITARKIDTGWLVFEDDRPGLRVSSLEPARVTGVIEHPRPHPLGGWFGPDGRRIPAPGARTDELRRRLSERATAGIKPPLGVVPRRIWEDRRLAELDRALVEYTAFGLPVDPAWQAEHDELLAWRATREPASLAATLAGRRAGKATAGMEAASAAIAELVRRSSVRRCGVLLVASPSTNALLAYVDDRIPEGQIIHHPGELPEGGVEALLASLYPPAGPIDRHRADLSEPGHVPGCFVRGPIRHCVEGCSWVDDGRERMEEG